jgi:hypothetical protein
VYNNDTSDLCDKIDTEIHQQIRQRQVMSWKTTSSYSPQRKWLNDYEFIKEQFSVGFHPGGFQLLR